MDIDPPPPSTSTPKKPKFTLKAPPRRKSVLVLPKRNSSDDDAEATEEFFRKVDERRGKRGPKPGKKSSGNNDTMSHGSGSSSIEPKDGNSKSSSSIQQKDGISTNRSNSRETTEKSVTLSPSIATKDGDTDAMLVDDETKSSSKVKNKYKDPWDPSSYYPVSLPSRRLGLGDPDFNAQEFGEEKEYNENEINSALELGLLENNDQKQMILFKFPPKLPLGKEDDASDLKDYLLGKWEKCWFTKVEQLRSSLETPLLMFRLVRHVIAFKML